MRTLRINNLTYEYPKTWNDLTDEAIFRLCKSIGLSESVPEMKLKTIMVHFGWKVARGKSILDFLDKNYFIKVKEEKKPILISAVDMRFIASGLNFMFREVKKKGKRKKNEVSFSLNPKLTRNPVQEIKTKKSVCIGPKDRLTNITFGEYKSAMVSFSRWSKDHNKDNLNKFCAALFRPRVSVDKNSPEYKGDEREEFNAFVVNARYTDFEKVPEETKMAIVLFWQGCLMDLAVTFPYVFPEASEDGKTPSKDPFFFLETITIKLSNQDATKDDAIDKAPLYRILLHLNEDLKEAEKIKAKIEKAKKK